MNERIQKAYDERPRNLIYELTIAAIVIALMVWSATAVETSGTTQNGAVIALNILSGIFHPDTDLLFNLTTQGVPYLLLETICIAFLGTVVGAVISIPLAFISASNLTPAPVAFAGRIIIMAIRTVPAFVYGLNIAEEMLANPAQTACRRVFAERMREKYGRIGRLNEAWHTSFAGFEGLGQAIYKAASLSDAAEADLKAFSEEMITRYVEIPAKALRQVDANHMNLGMRYAYLTDKSLLCGSQYFDVFSINSYQITPLEPVKKAADWLDKPVMVGEFHQGALDAGLTAHGIRGVTSQKERGCAYRYYLEQGLTHPHFLGAHYFQLNDQSCLGRFDGENYQIGLIDVCMREYQEMADAMRACHADMYRVAAGEKAAWDTVPEDIEPIHY